MPVVEVARFLTLGASSGWFGLACPAHCSSSLVLHLAIFVAGFACGSLTVIGLGFGFVGALPCPSAHPPPGLPPGQPLPLLCAFRRIYMSVLNILIESVKAVALSLRALADTLAPLFPGRSASGSVPGPSCLRAFAPLCPPDWATIALSYVKEVDLINSRRQDRQERRPTQRARKRRSMEKEATTSPKEEQAGRELDRHSLKAICVIQRHLQSSLMMKSCSIRT